MARFAPGDPVQTPLGKGVVREMRGNDRLVVEIQSRTVVIEERAATPRDEPRPRRSAPAGEATAPPADARRRAPAEIDLHGLTVEEALAHATQALNDAMLADLPELRLIHGRSSGRIRAALHRHLRQVDAIRAFRLDPRDPGVTIVSL